MASIDPLDVSPYLTMARRDIRTACCALIRHANRRPRCGSCPISDLCARSSDRDNRVSRKNSPDMLPKASLTLDTDARPAPANAAA